MKKSTSGSSGAKGDAGDTAAGSSVKKEKASRILKGEKEIKHRNRGNERISQFCSRRRTRMGIGKREETEWWRPSPRDTRLDRGRNGTQPIITDQAKLSFKDQESIRAGRVWWGWQENNLKCSKLCKSISQAPANIMLTWQIGLTPYTFPEEEYTL